MDEPDKDLDNDNEVEQVDYDAEADEDDVNEQLLGTRRHDSTREAGDTMEQVLPSKCRALLPVTCISDVQGRAVRVMEEESPAQTADAMEDQMDVIETIDFDEEEQQCSARPLQNGIFESSRMVSSIPRLRSCVSRSQASWSLGALPLRRSASRVASEAPCVQHERASVQERVVEEGWMAKLVGKPLVLLRCSVGTSLSEKLRRSPS